MLMVSPTPSIYDASNITTISPEDFNSTGLNATLKGQDEESENRLLFDYVVVPFTVIVILIIVAGLVVFLIRKKRLDKLRHHLMPLYSFDPAEEGEDWEAELLEEGTDHQPRGKNAKPSEQPQLSFRSNL